MSGSTLLLLLLLLTHSSQAVAYEYCGAYCIMASVFGMFGGLFCMCGLFCFIGTLVMLVYYLVDLSRKKKGTAPNVLYQTQPFPQTYSSYKLPLPPQAPSVQMLPPTQATPPPSYPSGPGTARPISQQLVDSQTAGDTNLLIVP